jgi:hypothetical protein
MEVDDGTTRHQQTGSFDFRTSGQTWHRVICVFDGVNCNMTMYVNGIETLNTNTSQWTGDISPSHVTTIGAHSTASTYPFNGMMADFQVWNELWTQSDATYDYLNPESLALNNGGTSLTESNLKLWYPMQDGHRGQQSYILDGANTGPIEEVLGDPNFTTTGTQASGVQGTYWWTGVTGATSSGWTIIDGKAVQSGNPDDTDTDNWLRAGTMNFDATGIYKIVIDVSSDTSGAIYSFGNQSATLQSNVEAGVTTYYYNGDGSSRRFHLNTETGVELTVNSISIKKVNDKHHATTVFLDDNNLVSNGTFDSNTTGWSAGNSATLSKAAGGNSGDCLKVLENGTGNPNALATISNTVVGRTYRLEFYHHDNDSTANTPKYQVSNASTGDDIIAIRNVASMTNATTTWIKETSSDFVATHTSLYLRLYNTASSSSGEAYYFDDVSIKEVGVASGWTDADQQLDIPQTALQSYNQLAWFGGNNEENGTLDSVINTGSTDWSLSFWLYHDDAGSGTVFIFGHDGTRNIVISEAYNLLQFREVTSATYYTLSANNAIKEGEWNHIVITTDGATSMTAYINGEAQTTNTSMSSTEINVTKIMHGYNDTGGYAGRGCMTEIAYFANTQLTQAQVNTLFNDGKAYDVELDSTLWSATTGYWRNNGLAEWKDKKGTNDINTENVTETLLLPAGVDASRDTQGFIMNRQKDTNALNLYDVGNVSGDIDDNVYVKLNNNPLVDTTISTDNQPFSVSLWVKPHRGYSSSQHGIFWLGDSATSMFCIGLDGTGTTLHLNVSYDANNISRPSINSVLPTDEWTNIIVCCNSGKHTGSNDQATVLTDSNASFDVDELINGWLHNNSKTQFGTITDNDATTITCAAGGFDHDTNNNYNIVKIYINGVADIPDTHADTGSASGVDNNNTYFVGINEKAQRQYVGEVDDILVYDNKWLTQKEVTRIYKAGKRSHR